MDRETQMQELLSRLAADPYDLVFVKELERLFDGQVEDLIELLEARAAETDDDEFAARLLVEAGRMAAVELQDLRRGIELVSGALERGEDTYVSVEAHLFDMALNEQAEELLGFFTDALEHFDEAAYQSRLYERMGVIMNHFLGDVEEAARAFEFALELVPDNVAALRSRQELARDQGDWVGVAELLSEEVEYLDDPSMQARTALELGEIYEEHFDDREQAEECFAVALQLDSESPQVRERLAQRGYEFDDEELAEEADVDDLDVDGDLLEEAEPAGEEFPFEEEEFAAEPAGDFGAEPAEETDVSQQTDDDPGTMELDDEMLVEAEPQEDDPGTMELDDDMLVEAEPTDGDQGGPPLDQAPPSVPSEESFAEESQGEDAADENFESVDEALDVVEDSQVSEVSEVSEISEISEVSEASDAVEEEEEVDDEFEVDEEYDEHEEGDEYEEDEEDEAQLGEDVGADVETEAGMSWHERFDALLDEVRESSDEERALELLTRAAHMNWRHRDDEDRGAELWQVALDCNLGMETFGHTAHLWDEDDFWAEIIEMVDDPSLEAAIAFVRLGDEERASQAAETADNDFVLAALDDREEAIDNWRKFQRAVEKRHDELDSDEKARRVYWYMADMAVALDDLDKEIDALRRLDRQVDDAKVRNRLAVLYRRAEKWPMYVDLVKQQAEDVGDEEPFDRIDLLREAIAVYRDEMNHDMMVVNTYKEILEIDPENLRAIDALIDKYEEMNRASELINMLQEKAELVSSDEERVELNEEIAELFLDRFRNQAEAIKAYEAILELRPHHAGAIEFLKEMYEKRRDWQKLIDVHKREIETLESETEKAEGFKHIAQLASDRLRKPEVATELWLEVREHAPEDPSALDALEKLYEKSRSYEELADVLETKIEAESDPGEKMKLFQKLGMLYSDRLEDSERAIEAWRGALELDPEDLKAKKALERLYIDNRDWDALEAFYFETSGAKDLVRLLETLAGTVDEDEVKIELLLRAARLWKEELDEVGRAERDLERVLEVDAKNERAAIQLEPIAREHGEFERLQKLYEIALEHRDEPEERREYQLKLADLFAEQLDDAQGAFRWYADAFGDDPSASEVIEPLEEAAERAGVWSDLAEAYDEALAEDSLELATRQTLRLRIGRVLADELDQFDEALDHLQAVLDEEEDNLEALAAMETIYRRTERWDDLMSVYRRRLELTEEADDKVQILQGMADIAERQADDVDTAIERYREALELDPNNEATLRELHRLYDECEDYDNLADAIRRQIALIEERAQQREPRDVGPFDTNAFLTGGFASAEASGEVDDFAESQLAEDGSGMSALEESSEAGLAEVSSAPEMEEASVEQVQEEAFESSEVSEVSEVSESDEVSEAELIDEASDAALEAISEAEAAFGGAYTEAEIERLVELRYELGVVASEHLGDDDEAVESLDKVLAWRPLHHQARHELETYLDDDRHSARVARRLTPVYEVQGMWSSLVDVLEIRCEQAEDPVETIALLERIGHVETIELGRAEDAFETYARLLRLDPANETGRRQLRRVTAATEWWHEAIDLYEELLDELDDEELRIEYLFDLGEMYADRLGDPETAQKLYHQVLDIDQASERALTELEALYSDTEQWHELRSIYDRKRELAETNEEVEELQFRTAVLHERMLEEPHEAIEVLVEMLDERPDNLRAVRMLDRLYRQQQMWHEVAENLEVELDLVDDEEQNEVKNRLAEVLAERLEKFDEAIDLYEEVLDDDPQDARALGALEAMMRSDRPSAARASRIVEPLYVERDAVEELIEALEVQADFAEEIDQQVELLHRIARLHEERAGRSEAAFDTYCRALGVRVDDQETIDHLYRIAAQIDHWDELALRLEAEADDQVDPDVQRDLLWRAARVCIDQLDDLERAAQLLRRVHELFADDLETVEKLEELYRQLQDFERLVDMLVTKAELVEEIDDKKQLLYQAATTFEEVLERPSDAVEVYRRVLEIDGADAHAIDRLEVLFTELERWQELLEVYERKLELAEDDEARKDLLYAMGPIYREHLDAPFEAIETYRQVLTLDDEELAAYEKLDALYAETEQWNEQLEVLERQMQLVSLDEDRLDLQYRIGQLWENQLGDALRAIEVYSEILDEDAGHVATTEALEDLITRGEYEAEAARVLEPIYEEANEWEKLVRIYDLLIEASGDPERKLELYGEVARIVEEELEDANRAFETYVRALGVDASRQGVLDELERLASALGLWDNLIDHFDEALAETADFEAIVSLHLRVARIYEEELQRPDPAIERFNKVLENDPENEEAILALDRLYQREGRWEELAEILQTRIYGAEQPEQARELRLRLATLYQEALDEPSRAIEVYQTVLMDDEENQQAIDSLERMFMDGREVQKIADILEPHYLERDQHEKLVEIYLQRLELLDDPIERYDLLMQVGRIFLNELDDQERALQAYGAALTEKPDDEEAFERLEELAQSTGQWGEAAGYYVDALESEQVHPEDALNLWMSLARILDEELGQIADAEQAYLSALEIDEGAPKALEALDRIYADQQRHEELADVLERRIAGLYDEEKIVELSYRLGSLQYNQLDQPSAAVETYRKILDLRPDHGDSLMQLERIHLEHQQWEELFDVLRRRADNTHEPDEKSDLLKRMANLAEEMLERPIDAIDLWREVLRLTPDDRDALSQLQRLYLEQERWSDLVEVLEHEVSLTEDPQERLGLYESLGTIWQEHLDNELQALEAFQEVLAIDPNHLGALEALHTIFERQADYTELADVVTRLIEHDAVGEERTLELWVELAEIYGDMLMQPPEAIECWKAVLTLDPDSDRALEELEQLYLQESMWEEAAGILERKADRVDDEQARIELLRRIADIWENKLLEAERAIEYYEQILEIDPGQMEASRSLENVYRNQGTEEAYQSLVEVYLGRAEVVADDPFERAETLRQAAQVFEQHLQQPESALLVQLSAFSPETLDDEQLLSDLERLADQTGLWDELIERAGDVASELPDGIEAADLHHKIGRWYADKLDQPDDAVYHLRRALGIEADNPQILKKLEELYRELASWPELATIIEQRIELTSDPDEQIALWRNLGELYERQLGEVDQAIEAYRRILEVDQSDLEAMESLDHIFDTYDHHEELIAILEQKAEATYEPDDIVAIKQRIAQIYDRDLDDPQRAIETYREVLNVDQTHQEALEALEALYLKTQQWDELLDVYERQLKQSHEPEDQVVVYGKMAAVYEDHFEDPESAVESYNNLLMVDPAHEGAIDSLERLYRNLERWYDLVEIEQRHIELLDDGARKVEILNELGRTQRDHLGDEHAAVEALAASVAIDDTQTNVLFELAELQENIGDAQSAVDSYSRLVELIDEAQDRAEIYTQMGELLELEIGDDDAAEEAYLETLDLVPGHRDAVEALRRIYERKGTWQPLIRALKKAEDASRDLDKKAEYLAEIGKIYEEKVDDRVNALSYYEEALENNARNVEAAEPLISMYMNEQRWEKAVPLLELVIEELEAKDAEPQRLHDLHLQAGKTFARLEQQEHALEHYRAAYEYDSTDFETQKGLGHLLYDHEYFEKAASVFENLEFQHLDRLEGDELVELYFRSGKIQQRFGETRRAIEYFIKAVEAEPHHRPSLEELVDLYEEQQNFEQVVDYSRQLLETEEEPAARFALLTRMGDLLAQKVGDRQRAVNVYLEALDIQPESMSVLRKLLDLYTNTKQWSEAVEILQQLIELESNDDRAATYNYTVGVIFRDEIGDPMEAVDYFDAALDYDVKELKAFEAIDRILTDAKEWKELERAYRRMLRRIAEADDGSMEKIKVTLWKNIGEIYRSRLGHVQSAINSYETAAGLDPDDEQVRLILAELYEKKADDPEGAIEQHKELIRLDPFRIESYRALFKAYIKHKAYDRAWCMSAALSFLQSANEQEEKFYRQYLGGNVSAARGQFKQDLYRLLYHPDQDMLISFIMSIIGQGLRDYYARRLKKVWDVHPRKDRLDLDQEMLFCKLYKYAAQTVGLVPAPNVYLKRDQALGIRNANADPPAVIIGADMMQGKDDRELAFSIGKQLCWMRPEHYMGSVGFPTENLKLLFMAAMHITDPSLGVAQQLGEQGAEVIAELQTMPAQMLNQMRKYMKQYLSSGQNPNLSAWLTQVEHTCIRMGLVLCGDLHEAASCIKNDPNPIGKASVKDKIREMVLFSISDEYFEIRERLGLAIDK